MEEYFTLPGEAATSTLSFVGEVMSGYWQLIAIAIGIPLAFYVVRKLKSLIPGR